MLSQTCVTACRPPDLSQHSQSYDEDEEHKGPLHSDSSTDLWEVKRDTRHCLDLHRAIQYIGTGLNVKNKNTTQLSLDAIIYKSYNCCRTCYYAKI